MNQHAFAGVDPACHSVGLLTILGTDNLSESHPSIENPAGLIGRQQTLSLIHLSHSLHVAGMSSEPKLIWSRDLRLFQRYWD